MRKGNMLERHTWGLHISATASGLRARVKSRCVTHEKRQSRNYNAVTDVSLGDN